MVFLLIHVLRHVIVQYIEGFDLKGINSRNAIQTDVSVSDDNPVDGLSLESYDASH